MAKVGAVTVAGKRLKCQHCGLAEFEVRTLRLQTTFLYRRARGATCTTCRLLHTFEAPAELELHQT